MPSWEVMWVEALQRLLLAAELLMLGGVVWCGVVFLGVEGIKKSYCDGHCDDTEIAGYQCDLRNEFFFLGCLLC